MPVYLYKHRPSRFSLTTEVRRLSKSLEVAAARGQELAVPRQEPIDAIFDLEKGRSQSVGCRNFGKYVLRFSVYQR